MLRNAVVCFLSLCLFGALQAQDVKQAVAEIHPASNSGVSGRVVFIQEKDGIRVVAELNGLKPGPHGFHIHEKGDCSASDATSAGGHFNPTQEPHAAPDAEKRHVGDLGNIVADQNGHAVYERTDKVIRFDGEKSILGKSVIVHEKADDFKTQPSGDAGARIGCGVILPIKSP
jgi:Cu-Zn family superoxide dismutase